MDVGNWNPGLSTRFEEKNYFVSGILIQSQVLGRANRKWMLVIEIRVCAKDSKRILSLIRRFSFKSGIGGANRVHVDNWNPGLCKRFEKNIEFDSGILVRSQLLREDIRKWMLVIEIRFCGKDSKWILSLIHGFSLQVSYWKGANRKWMLVIEIRVWTKDSNRIFSLPRWFSFKIKNWDKPIRNGCSWLKSGFGCKIRNEYLICFVDSHSKSDIGMTQ